MVILVALGGFDRLDHAVLGWCIRHRQPHVADAARHLTRALSPAVDAAVLAVGATGIAFVRRRPQVVYPTAIVGLTTAAIVIATKLSLDRHVSGIPTPHDGGSFPSGHTASFLVCFGSLTLIGTNRHGRWRRMLLAAVSVTTVAVAAALVYQGSHWLTDTVASIVLGVALLSLQARCQRRSDYPAHPTNQQSAAGRTCTRPPAPAMTQR